MSKYIHCPQCHRIVGEYSADGKSVEVCHGGRCTRLDMSGATTCSCGCTVQIKVPKGEVKK